MVLIKTIWEIETLLGASGSCTNEMDSSRLQYEQLWFIRPTLKRRKNIVIAKKNLSLERRKKKKIQDNMSGKASFI